MKDNDTNLVTKVTTPEGHTINENYKKDYTVHNLLLLYSENTSKGEVKIGYVPGKNGTYTKVVVPNWADKKNPLVESATIREITSNNEIITR